MRTKVFRRELASEARLPSRLREPGTVTLTPDQQVLLLKINNTVGDSDTRVYRYIRQKMVEGWLVREGTTVSALARKGLVDWDRDAQTVRPTLEGYWLWDTLKIEERLGK